MIKTWCVVDRAYERSGASRKWAERKRNSEQLWQKTIEWVGAEQKSAILPLMLRSRVPAVENPIGQ